MDAAGIPALKEAIRHIHGLEAEWVESAPVHETHEGETVWEGEVQVFRAPDGTAVYAWSHESGPGGRRRFYAILRAGPVTGPAGAVRTAIVADARKQTHDVGGR